MTSFSGTRRLAAALFITLLLTLPACREDTPSSPPERIVPSVFIPVGTLKSPRGIAVDASGDIWIADTYNDEIRRFGPDGIEKTFIQGFVLPAYMGVDPATGDVLTVANGRSIIRIDPTNNDASVEASLSSSTIDTTSVYDVNLRQSITRSLNPNEIGDISGTSIGDIFVSVLANGSENFIIRVRNGQANAIAVSSQRPTLPADTGTRFLAVDTFGTVFTAFIMSGGLQSGTARVYALNPVNLAMSLFLSDPSITGGARGAGIDAAGDLYIADPPVQQMVIVSTASQRTIDIVDIPFIEGMNYPAAWDVGVAPDGSVYVAVVDLFDTANELGAVLKYTRTSATSYFSEKNSRMF